LLSCILKVFAKISNRNPQACPERSRRGRSLIRFGIQKEAYFLKVPCITLRSETEWVETLEDGWNVLAGCNKGKIIKSIKSFSPKHPQHKHFGDGKTAKRIVRILVKEN